MKKATFDITFTHTIYKPLHRVGEVLLAHSKIMDEPVSGRKTRKAGFGNKVGHKMNDTSDPLLQKI